MKYLCLCCDDEAHFRAMEERERDALLEETFAYADTLRESGILLEGLPLESVDSAVTLRVRNGKLSSTDGPFAETKEQVGGFLLIEARDFNEALRIASKWPPARFGSIEVRPVAEEMMKTRRMASEASR